MSKKDGWLIALCTLSARRHMIQSWGNSLQTKTDSTSTYSQIWATGDRQSPVCVCLYRFRYIFHAQYVKDTQFVFVTLPRASSEQHVSMSKCTRCTINSAISHPAACWNVPNQWCNMRRVIQIQAEIAQGRGQRRVAQPRWDSYMCKYHVSAKSPRWIRNISHSS